MGLIPTWLRDSGVRPVYDDDEPFGEGECDCIYHAPSAADEDGWWEPVASCPLHGDTL